MGQLGEIMSFGLQARIDLDGGARTILELLRTERMDGGDRAAARRPSIKERLGLKVLACCGATWGLVLGLGSTAVTAAGDDEEEDMENGSPRISTVPAENREMRPWATTGMNLATALAAERQLRAKPEMEAARVPLVRLLEQTEEEVGCGWVCCVCMVRNKGAAFIPCGHTFCRVCSRELWLGRATCPLCNRPILQILDIY